MTSPAKRSRWLDWRPQTQISGDSVGDAPTKPSKPGSVGFVGATSAEAPEIHVELNPAELARASAILNRAGIRIMQLAGVISIGIWSDLDGPEIRGALRALGSAEVPVRYLDGAGIPSRYKLRRVEGEAVPMDVLVEMERHPDEPWEVRDRMLQEMGWRPRGVTRKPVRITAATVREGEKKGAERKR